MRFNDMTHAIYLYSDAKKNPRGGGTGTSGEMIMQHVHDFHIKLSCFKRFDKR